MVSFVLLLCFFLNNCLVCLVVLLCLQSLCCFCCSFLLYSALCVVWFRLVVCLLCVCGCFVCVDDFACCFVCVRVMVWFVSCVLFCLLSLIC